MAMLKMSPPWIEYYRKINEMFKKDADISVVYDEDQNIIKLYVDGDDKVAVLQELLPPEKEFGNVKVTIMIIPSNQLPRKTVRQVLNLENTTSLYRTLFNGNLAVNYIEEVHGIYEYPLCYVIFEKAVVQYFNDNIGDYYGQCSTLYQDIAKDIFVEKPGVFFCTDPKDRRVKDIVSF